MKWNDFLDLESTPVPSTKTKIQIPFKVFGIPKQIIVRTKGNGGIQ